MRTFYLFIVSLITLNLFQINTNAQVDLLINITHETPVIDGEIDYLWENHKANPLNNWLVGSPVPNSDLSAWFKTTWDKENLYFLVAVTDDVLINDSPEVWRDDAIEIYLDINNDKLSSYGSTDYQYSFRWNDTNIHTGGPRDGVAFKLVKSTTGYTLEVKFPWATLGQSSPQKGVLLGLDVHVHDDDDGGDRDNKISWKATIDQSYQNPSLFATAQLMGEETVLPKAVKPNVSVNHGFYDRPFDVTISSPVTGMKIIYTLDGTLPGSSATTMEGNSPLTLRIDPAVAQQRGITPAVTLRASALKDGYDISPAVTRTYIFLDQIDLQTNFPGHDWPDRNINEQVIDLLMDAKVLNDPRYNQQMRTALTQIPTVSIVTDNKNLFDPEQGIYVNAFGDGREWERPASIELINPDGSKGFQVDAGLRIRGGYSRNPWFRKHAFRLFFRSEYGPGRLNFPMFEDEGVDRFDKLDLRCSQNYSWSKGTSEAWYATYNRDVFSRDIQGLMGQPYTRSRYYHLYLNGMYWGLYQSQERAEARFAESYLGGNRDDYDVVKKGNGNYIEATDGNLDAWREIYNITRQGYSNISNYFKLEGLDDSGLRNLSSKVLVDIDNLIDYMNIVFYTGNFDAPVSAFVSNRMPNNFYAIYDRKGTRGFIFCAHDNEHSLLIDPIGPGSGITENRVNIGNIIGNNRMYVSAFDGFHPQWLHHRLVENEDYRMRFADRAYRYLFNDGILTPENAAQVFFKRSLEFDDAIIGESARWGDVENWALFTKDDHWKPNIERAMRDYFPHRTNIVIEQLQNEKLLPTLAPPEIRINNNLINQGSIEIIAGAGLDLRNPNHTGSLFFTLDGIDPRKTGGGISTSAVNGENLYRINLHQSAFIKARIYNGEEWSTLTELRVNVDQFISGIQITEIHYNPLSGDGFAGSQYEFIEIKNTGDQAVNLTNAAFVQGIRYTFNTETILYPGAFIVLASQPYTFKLRYGFEPFGQYQGQLDNSGERVTLVSATGQEIASVRYDDSPPWPSSADGLGFSLVPATNNLNSDWDNGSNWRASSVIGGTPGADDTGAIISPIWVTEVLASTDRPDVDAIELFNPNDHAVDISHWFLSDNRALPQKWQIPSGNTIPAHGYKVFYEGYYSDTIKEYNINHFGGAFALSAQGEEAYVFSGNSNGQLTGYEHGFTFDHSEKGVSFGRHITSTGDIHHVAQSVNTLGSANSHPKVGPVIFNQIMYHPVENHFEYLELINISDQVVDLYDESIGMGWRIAGVNFNFPQGTKLLPGESVYLTESAIHSEDFRLMKGIDTNVQLFNYPGKLDNSGERIELRKPAPPYMKNDSLIFPYIVIETVRYNNKAPWPLADGNGKILKRVDQNRYANDPKNWLAAPAGIFINNFIIAAAVEGVPFSHTFSAIGGMEPYSWSIESGFLPSGLNLNGSTGTIKGTASETGQFMFKLAVIDHFDVSSQMTLALHANANTLPVAMNDLATTLENFHVTIDVLANDTDNDGEKSYWGLSVVKPPANGQVVINYDKTITYFPDKDFTGTDSFTYTITDFKGTVSALASVNVVPLVNSLQIRVSQPSDDAEENIHTNQLWTNSSDLELTFDPSPGGEQIVGIRFGRVPLPKGANVTKAYLQFTTDESTSGATSLFINAENSNNALAFSTNNLISTRPLTTNVVNWQPEPWTVIDEASEKQRSPDLKLLIKEVIDRDGWQEGNAMAFIISGTGSRVAYAFDGDPTKAPQLHIEYRTTNEEPSVPVAIAQVTSLPMLKKTVALDGSGSYSTDGRPVQFLWNIESRPAISESQLNNPHIVSPSFVPDFYGEYIIKLTVDNGVKTSNEAFLTIKVENHAPIADAGFDQVKIKGAPISLNGSRSYDPEGFPITYNWILVDKPQGSAAQIVNPTFEKPELITDLEGVYRIVLIVSDGDNESVPDTASITITGNLPPVAFAGNDFQVYTGETVRLSSDGSYDPEDSGISYRWNMVSKPASSIASLSNTTSRSPSFLADQVGKYTIELIVNDGVNNSEPAIVTVTVVHNTPPVANAGQNQLVDRGAKVQLDGSASYDPDGTALAYLWTFVTKPHESMATLNNYTVVDPSFVADMPGLYTLRLQVSDGIANHTADVQVVVNPSNTITAYSSDFSLKVYPNPFNGKLYIDTECEIIR
jgi:hypothetical protein